MGFIREGPAASRPGYIALEGQAYLVAEPVPPELLGQALVSAGHITGANLENALEIQRRTGEPLGQILLREGVVSERDLNRVLARHLSVRAVEIDKTPSSDEALALIPESYALEHMVLPISIDGNELLVAVLDPGDQALLAELRVITRREVRPAITQRSLLPGAIRERYRVLPGVDQFVKQFESTDQRPGEAISPEMLQLTENAPVVQVVNLLITQGLRDRASDIHIEPKKDRVRVRFRIDGVLTDVVNLPLTMASGIASRLKILAELDIVAIQSSLTGHLVLTSLHAIDAPGVLQRLMDMGIEGFLISSAVVGVVAQRLMRRTCDHCAGTGYHGRIGVFEVLRVTDGVRPLIAVGASQTEIRDQAVRDGMTTMRQDAVSKVDLGVTTMAEMHRSVYVQG